MPLPAAKASTIRPSRSSDRFRSASSHQRLALFGSPLLAGLVTFFWYPDIDVRRRPVLLFDGAGLALFAVTGTQKALAAGLNPVMAALMGMLTGIGGGMLRDVLVNETPTVLRADLYAVAALAAGVVVAVGRVLHYPVFCSHDRGCTPMLLAQSHGHTARLASADCRDVTSTRLTRPPSGKQL